MQIVIITQLNVESRALHKLKRFDCYVDAGNWHIDRSLAFYNYIYIHTHTDIYINVCTALVNKIAPRGKHAFKKDN